MSKESSKYNPIGEIIYLTLKKRILQLIINLEPRDIG